MQNSQKHYPDRRAHHAHDDEALNSSADEIPTGGTPKALLIGLIAGIINALINVGITFLGGSLYQQVASEPRHVSPTSADYIVAALSCLSFFIGLLICFFAGFSAGKRVVLRKAGFYAGALAGIIIFLYIFLERYIPNYPGNLASQGPPNAAALSGGLVVSLIFLCIWIFMGGLLGLWGAARATRHHPYYQQQEEEDS